MAGVGRKLETGDARGRRAMIEFKAECGHTVRAKDDDAGSVVRCAYCGRSVQAPVLDLSVLAQDLPPPPDPTVRKRRWFFSRKRKPRAVEKAGFNPFPVILKLIYFAALIVVVVVLSRRFVLPMLDPDARAERFAGGMPTASIENVDPAMAPTTTASPAAFRDMNSQGLLTVDATAGVYVASTPPGATVFCLEESKAPLSGRIHQAPGVLRLEANRPPYNLADGSYVVEVVFAWNDPQLSDSSLSGFEDYVRFRRSVERATQSNRTLLVNQFFLPDEATDVFIDQTVDQFYIVRQYRGVTVRQSRSPGVRALFLPRLAQGDGGAFSVDRLLSGYIPEERAYNFDENHVRGELNYYGVKKEDQSALIQALVRIGQIPYATPDGQIRLFKIGIQDGEFATRVLRLAQP